MNILRKYNCETGAGTVKYYALMQLNDGSTIEFASRTPKTNVEWLAMAQQFMDDDAVRRAPKPIVVAAVAEDGVRVGAVGLPIVNWQMTAARTTTLTNALTTLRNHYADLETWWDQMPRRQRRELLDHSPVLQRFISMARKLVVDILANEEADRGTGL